jgi:hypothetical protein
MKLSRKLHDRAISPDKQFELLTEPFVKEGEMEALSWNERCSPPWSLSSDCAKEDDLEYLLQESWRSCTDRPGCKTEEGRAAQAQEDFGPVELEDSGERVYTSADETRANTRRPRFRMTISSPSTRRAATRGRRAVLTRAYRLNRTVRANQSGLALGLIATDPLHR